jgi:hypothetical protein
MKRCLPLVAAGAVLVAACRETNTPTAPTQSSSPPAPTFLTVQGEQGHIHIMLRKPNPGVSARSKSRGTGISYHGGPIFYATKVAAIYWSSATIYNGGPAPATAGTGAQDGSLVGFFLRNLGGSPYFNINTTYFDGTGTHVQNSVSYTQFWADGNGSSGTVSDAQVQQEVLRGFSSGALTYDPSTLYAVFSGPGVNLGGGFGTQYCAYHGHFSSSVGDVKYAVMPYDWSDPAGCSAITGSGPNGDPAADTEVNTLAHETEETTTDEDLNAWYDRRGFENADKCAWTFGTTYTTANGSTANMNLNGQDFLIQRNWVNAGSGGCLLSW